MSEGEDHARRAFSPRDADADTRQQARAQVSGNAPPPRQYRRGRRRAGACRLRRPPGHEARREQ
eukprot:91548-Alexandrium_andersonii.AAC.1